MLVTVTIQDLMVLHIYMECSHSMLCTLYNVGASDFSHTSTESRVGASLCTLLRHIELFILTLCLGLRR